MGIFPKFLGRRAWQPGPLDGDAKVCLMLPMLCLRIFQRIRSAWYDGVEEKDEETEDESENGDQPEITEPEEAVEEVEEGWLGSMVSTLQPSVSIL